MTLAMPKPARAGRLGTDIIALFPKEIGEFAYADLKKARSQKWFPQLQEQMLPDRFRQFEKFLASAGVDPNSQVDGGRADEQRQTLSIDQRSERGRRGVGGVESSVHAMQQLAPEVQQFPEAAKLVARKLSNPFKTVLCSLIALAAIYMGSSLEPARNKSDPTADAKSQACPSDDSGLTLPASFCATVFADDIGHARYMVAAPSGVLYVNTWSGR